jgi:hypothetical protein
MPPLVKELFFIAPFGMEGSLERRRSDGILDLIIAGAAKEVGLTAVRGDQITAPGDILAQLRVHLSGARAVVADLTGLNPNVMYELAIRHNEGLPVVQIAEEGTVLPFNIKHMRTIYFAAGDFKSAAQCRDGVVAQLREVLKREMTDGPAVTGMAVRALCTCRDLWPRTRTTKPMACSRVTAGRPRIRPQNLI